MESSLIIGMSQKAKVASFSCEPDFTIGAGRLTPNLFLLYPLGLFAVAERRAAKKGYVTLRPGDSVPHTQHSSIASGNLGLR